MSPITHFERLTKRDVIKHLERQLEVAGCATPWNDIAKNLYHLPKRILGALFYRIERARAQSYEEGSQDATRYPLDT